MRRSLHMYVVAGAMLALTGLSAHAAATIQPDKIGSYGARVDALNAAMDVAQADDGMFRVDVAVSTGDEIVFEKRIGDIFSTSALPVIQIAEIDPGNDALEVFVSHYSGGAHCCNLVSAITRNASGQWVEVDVGQFDGGPDPDSLRDLDGDGQAEFLTHDSRFLYQFAPYAGSFAPPRLLSVRGAELVDLTTAPVAEYVLSSAAHQLGDMPENGEARNSWLATYTAIQILQGAAEPFARAEADYDRNVTWGMDYCLDTSVAVYDCADDRKAVRPFPEALRLFLADTGYVE